MSMVLLRFMACERHALLASPFVMFAPLMLRYGYEISHAFVDPVPVRAGHVSAAARDARGWDASGSASVGTRFDGPSQDCRSTMVDRLRHSGGVGMYSQYMMAFVWMTHVLWLYVALRRHGHARRFPRMLIPYALAVALVHSMDSFRGRPGSPPRLCPVEGDHESE